MTCRLDALCIDATDPHALAQFWSDVLGRQLIAGSRDEVALMPNADGEFTIRFRTTTEAKSAPLQMHFDLTSTSLADQQETVAKVLRLGGRTLDIGQGDDATHVVLADLEENEFCVIEPGNNFLADCGFIGALAGEGSPAAGYFWSAVLAWPLVWDQDEETAIQSPRGGTKITWGGPPLTPKAGKCRWHFDVGPTADSDQHSELERLLALGATPIDIGQGDVDRVVLTDPDGHEFCLLP